MRSRIYRWGTYGCNRFTYFNNNSKSFNNVKDVYFWSTTLFGGYYGYYHTTNIDLASPSSRLDMKINDETRTIDRFTSGDVFGAAFGALLGPYYLPVVSAMSLYHQTNMFTTQPPLTVIFRVNKQDAYALVEECKKQGIVIPT